MNFSSHRNEDENWAALIIQRSFRKRGQTNENRLVDQTSEKQEKIRKLIILHSFSMRKNEIKKLCTEIDKLSGSLMEITKLEDCEKIETFSTIDDENDFFSIARDKHAKELQSFKLKWWQKLEHNP